jgi:hypothetical protein
MGPALHGEGLCFLSSVQQTGASRRIKGEIHMKHLKMLGLAAIAALGLMAFVGASAASGTTLTTNSNGTGVYPTGTGIHSTLTKGTSAILTDGSGNKLVTCTESTVAGNTSNESGTTIAGNISSLTFGGCSTTVHVDANGSLEIHMTATNEGTVTGKGSVVTVTIFGVVCGYGTGTGTTLGTITGGKAPILNIAAVGLTKVSGGFLCPGTAGWDANYTVTTPHALYIH